MPMQKLDLNYKILWNDIDPSDQGIEIIIDNSTEERLQIEVDWSCRFSDPIPPKIVDGVMVCESSLLESYTWAEEAIDWVEPGKTKSFFSDPESIRNMVVASEVLSSDLASLTAKVDGEFYEIMSGAELYDWLHKEVPIEFG